MSDNHYGLWRGPTLNSGIRLETKEDLLALFNFAVRHPLTDLHIQTGYPVMMGFHNALTAITYPLKKATMENVMRWMTNQDSIVAQLQGGSDYDSAFTIHDRELVDEAGYPVRHRFRLNITANHFEGDLGYQASLRYIPSRPPTVEQVQLEEEIIDNMDAGPGAVLFVGATGSGKTNSIAAILVHIIEGKTSIQGNLLTYESPVEFTYDTVPTTCCIVSQSEIPFNLRTFESGTRNSLRRKPCLILVGELRDRETIVAAAEAANNGHPILSTTHANSVEQTFKRLCEKFPPEQQTQAFYSQIATTNLIVAQRIVPMKGEENKHICLREWLSINNDVRRKLEEVGYERHDRVIREFMNSGELGRNARPMMTTVKKKWAEGLISSETALRTLRDFGHRGLSEKDLAA